MSRLCASVFETTNERALETMALVADHADLIEIRLDAIDDPVPVVLVLAAEKCPARCIHPGKPRAGDASATDELVARAAPFN